MKFPDPILEVYQNTKIVDLDNYSTEEARLRLKKRKAEQMAGMVANKVYQTIYEQIMGEES